MEQQSLTFHPKDRQEWLKLKSDDVSSTEVSALFGVSPYLTKFELYHTKKDRVIIELEDNERMKWGRRLEDVIAAGFAEDNGLILRKMMEYMRHPTQIGMGASFDYEIIGVNPVIASSIDNYKNIYQKAFLQHGAGILEIKKVDSLIYRDHWEEYEAPQHIEFQAQQQMEISGRQWCAICPLVGGNELKDFIRYRDPEMGAGLTAAVKDFWALQAPPAIDWEKDAEFIINLYRRAGIEVIYPEGVDASSINDLCTQYERYKLQASEGEDMKKIIKAKLMQKAGEAGKMLTGLFDINLTEVKENLGTPVTPDMIGKIINARKGYRQCRISKT